MTDKVLQQGISLYVSKFRRKVTNFYKDMMIKDPVTKFYDFTGYCKINEGDDLKGVNLDACTGDIHYLILLFPISSNKFKKYMEVISKLDRSSKLYCIQVIENKTREVEQFIQTLPFVSNRMIDGVFDFGDDFCAITWHKAEKRKSYGKKKKTS